MTNNVPIYSSRLIKHTCEYLASVSPDIDLDDLYMHAGLVPCEFNDTQNWITQRQNDLFFDGVYKKSGMRDFARDVGRHFCKSLGLGNILSYILGLISLKSLYLSTGKLAPLITRGATITAKSIGPNSVEIISIPKTGVHEQPYQCEFRKGTFESIAKPFTGRYAQVEHPECVLKGDCCCRYITKWEITNDLKWKKRRNLFVLFSVLSSAATFSLFPLPVWGYIPISSSIITSLLTIISSHYKTRGFSESVKRQGDAAEGLIKEINMHHDHSLFFQKIGLITATPRNVEETALLVIHMMEKFLDFQCGFIMLKNEDNGTLKYISGYGVSQKYEKELREIDISVRNAEMKNIYQDCILRRKSLLINDVNKDVPGETLPFHLSDDTRSVFCVPIVHEGKSYGLLTVANTNTIHNMDKADLNVVRCVASQIALSISNTNTFNELVNSEREYRDMIENTNSIIMRKTPQGNITFFNEFAQNYFGYTEKEVLKKNAIGSIFPETEASKKYIRQLSESLIQNPDHQIARETACIMKNNKQSWVAWTHKPIFDASGSLKEILCVGNDITLLKSRETEKKDLKSELQQVKKLEALGTFAGTVAHDFNNILGAIILNTELANNEIKGNENITYALMQVLQSGKDAKTIVKRILSFARISDISLKPVRIADCVSNTIKLLKVMLPSTIVIQEDIRCHDVVIIGDEIQIQALMINLCKNAVQAMDRTSHGCIKISLSMAGSRIRLSVKDNGRGMVSDIMDRIFDPYFSTRPGGGGKGMGLPIVQRIVFTHKGTIDVESLPYMGTIVHVYFPVKKIVKALVGEKKDSVKKGNESIFLIDDEIHFLDANRRVLERLGYDVTTCNGSIDAVEKFKKNPYIYDLVITDMTMPFMMGDELAEALKKIRPDIPIILCSGYGALVNKNRKTELDIDRYLNKPLNIEELSTAIRDVLDHRYGSTCDKPSELITV